MDITIFYTKRGLIQGSWLSPLLFNVYINDLLLELEKNYFIKAYADDLVVGLTNPNDLDECLDIINRWSTKNDIKINANKSGLLRILGWKGKIIDLMNKMNIPEVEDYNYLGVCIDQSLKFRKECCKLKSKEIILISRFGKLGYNDLSFDVKLILFKVLIMQLLCYPMTSILSISPVFKKCIKSICYRFLKLFFCIRWNPSQEKTFNFFNIDLESIVSGRR